MRPLYKIIGELEVKGRLFIRGSLSGLDRELPGVDVIYCLLARCDCDKAHAVVVKWPMPVKLDVDRFKRVARLVAKDVGDGLFVLVHCLEGKNRSGLTAALALRELINCSGEAALVRVRERRPGALYDKTFADYLRALPELKGADDGEGA